jgi:hypothetical protein
MSVNLSLGARKRRVDVQVLQDWCHFSDDEVEEPVRRSRERNSFRSESHRHDLQRVASESSSIERPEALKGSLLAHLGWVEPGKRPP